MTHPQTYEHTQNKFIHGYKAFDTRIQFIENGYIQENQKVKFGDILVIFGTWALIKNKKSGRIQILKYNYQTETWNKTNNLQIALHEGNSKSLKLQAFEHFENKIENKIKEDFKGQITQIENIIQETFGTSTTNQEIEYLKKNYIIEQLQHIRKINKIREIFYKEKKIKKPKSTDFIQIIEDIKTILHLTDNNKLSDEQKSILDNIQSDIAAGVPKPATILTAHPNLHNLQLEKYKTYATQLANLLINDPLQNAYFTTYMRYAAYRNYVTRQSQNINYKETTNIITAITKKYFLNNINYSTITKIYLQNPKTINIGEHIKIHNKIKIIQQLEETNKDTIILIQKLPEEKITKNCLNGSNWIKKNKHFQNKENFEYFKTLKPTIKKAVLNNPHKNQLLKAIKQTKAPTKIPTRQLKNIIEKTKYWHHTIIVETLKNDLKKAIKANKKPSKTNKILGKKSLCTKG